jgi:hypothetical protein
MRLARGFLASAELPFEARYRSYMEVFGDSENCQRCCAPGRRSPTPWPPHLPTPGHDGSIDVIVDAGDAAAR